MTELEKGIEAFEKQDYKTAFGILSPLGQASDAKAGYFMGLMCEMGYGIPQNYSRAKEWYLLAFKKDDAMAQFKMGVIHYHGLMGIKKDVMKAQDCFTSSAKQGHAEALYYLGEMHEKGNGRARSAIDAHIYYNISAANGYEKAAEARDRIAKEMSFELVASAQDLAWEWIQNNLKQ